MVDTLLATLSEVDVKTIGDTLGDAETRIAVQTLVCKLEVVAEALVYAASLARRCSGHETLRHTGRCVDERTIGRPERHLAEATA